MVESLFFSFFKGTEIYYYYYYFLLPLKILSSFLVLNVTNKTELLVP